jgi:trk system potassium uptake protein TrkA
VGAYLARLLLDAHYEVKLNELRPAHLHQLEHDLPPEVLVYGDGADPRVLQAAGIALADALAAVTGSDETNLVAAALARFEYGVPRVIGRVNNPKNAWMYTPTMGVDMVVNQADRVGKLMLEEITAGGTTPDAQAYGNHSAR